MELIKLLWRGDIALTKTYWLFGVCVNLLLMGGVSYFSFLNPQAISTSFGIASFFILYAFIMTYSPFIFVCVWRSANKYKGPVTWANLAKLSVIYGVVNYAITISSNVEVFKDGFQNFYETVISSDDLKYIGKYKEGKPHGQGTKTYPDGVKYEGEWKNGSPDGQGTATYPDGDKYVGGLKDGLRHGQGTYTFFDGGEYIGEFKDNLKHGQGIETYPDGVKYEGEWKNGKRHGQGTKTSPDGSKYVGEWKDDLPEGQGTETYSDGSKYVGEWKKGAKHGSGVESTPDKENKIGYWINGTYAGKEKPNTRKACEVECAEMLKRGELKKGMDLEGCIKELCAD